MPSLRLAAVAAALLALTPPVAAGPASAQPSTDGAPIVPPPAAATAATPGTRTVEIVLDGVTDASQRIPVDLARQIAGAGGEVVGPGTGSRVLVEVPAARAIELDVAGAEVRDPVGMSVPLRAATRPAFGPQPGDSAAAIGAGRWHDAGITGTGVRVGVIDFFSMSFWNEAEMGPRPTAANGRAMCRDAGIDCIAAFGEPALNGAAGQHGPAVVEVLRDVAPAADIFIAAAETYSDYVEVLDWFAANGVTIISRSLGTFLDGPGDGTGPTAELVDHAADLGMVWINATGNEADGGYWRGPALRPGGNVVTAPGHTVRFVDGPDRDLLPVAGCTTATLRWNEGWADPSGPHSRYDLLVHEIDTTTGLVLATTRASTADEPLRQLEHTCPQHRDEHPSRLFLQVEYRGGGTPADDVIEIQDYQAGLQYHQRAYSAAIPAADSRNPSAIAVGAVEPVDGTEIADYSSRGPTNDGRIKPDLAAPAGVGNTVYGTFSGTSAATPAAAGVAALLLDAGLATPGPALAALLRATTLPVGEPVPNTTYGAGVLRLPAPPTAPAASPPTAYHPLAAPRRIVDTRATSPVGPTHLTGRREPGILLDIPVQELLGRTTGSVAAVALNLTVVDAVEPGWVQVVPTRAAAIGAYSNVNLDAAGQTRGNLVQVPLGEDGSISVYAGSGGDVLIDVLGIYEYDAANTVAGRFRAIAPRRVLDTRVDGQGERGSGPDGSVRAGEAVCIDSERAGIDARRVEALVVNITATEVTASGYVQALPTGSPIGASSTLNPLAGTTMANTTIVPLGAACGEATRSASVAFDAGTAAATAHLVVDVTGYITSDADDGGTGGLFVPLTPGRVLDTRPGVLTTDEIVLVGIAGRPGPTPAVPATATAVAVNLTATDTTGWGYASAWPAGEAAPATSSVNWSGPQATIANGALLRLSSGGLALRSVTPGQPSSAAHLVDVFGYYT